MASEKEHPVAGIVFLALVAALLAFAAKVGIESSLREKVRKRVFEAATIADEGDAARALQLLEVIVKEHPDNAEAVFMFAGVRADLGQLDEADKLFQRVLELEPDDWEAVAERAAIAKRKGDVDGAIALLNKIPVGKGHLRERLNDQEWYRLRSDPRLAGLLEKHQILYESTVRNTENK